MITDLDHIGNGSMFIGWKFPLCSQIISAYEIQFTAAHCDELLIYYTESNATTTIVTFFNLSNTTLCSLDNCIFRIRGMLRDGNHTQFSPCVSIYYQMTISRKCDS